MCASNLQLPCLPCLPVTSYDVQQQHAGDHGHFREYANITSALCSKGALAALGNVEAGLWHRAPIFVHTADISGLVDYPCRATY